MPVLVQAKIRIGPEPSSRERMVPKGGSGTIGPVIVPTTWRRRLSVDSLTLAVDTQRGSTRGPLPARRPVTWTSRRTERSRSVAMLTKMPPVRSWMANPWSKVLEEKAPEGTVTEPLTVTTVPSGRARAAAMSIRLAARLGRGRKRAAAKRTATIQRREGNDLMDESIRISFLWGPCIDPRYLGCTRRSGCQPSRSPAAPVPVPRGGFLLSMKYLIDIRPVVGDCRPEPVLQRLAGCHFAVWRVIPKTMLLAVVIVANHLRARGAVLAGNPHEIVGRPARCEV